MSNSLVDIISVSSHSDLKSFVDFPNSLYQHSPHYVPAIRSNELALFNPDKNPAYDHCESSLYIARQGNNVVGRIAVIINHKENNGAEKRAARFGWVDFIDDAGISEALFLVGETWARQRGCEIIKGPYGFSNMDKAGLLTFGYDELPSMAVIYNYPYYLDHIHSLGYTKLAGWHEYEASVPDQIPARVSKFADMVKKRYELVEHNLENKGEVREIGYKIFELLNQTYRDLEGFIPHSPKQISYFVDSYISLINPDFISVVLDKKDDLVGFGITMPSFSRALQKAKGKIFPFGFLHLQKAMRKNDRADLYLIAVRPDLQGKGVTAIIFRKIIQTFINYNIRLVDTNPELESNHQVQNLWKGYNIRLHKKRMSFIKEL